MNSALLLLAVIILLAITILLVVVVLSIFLFLRKNKKQSRLHHPDNSRVENYETPTVNM